MSSLIKLENISKIYELANEKIHALRNINFEVKPGEMTAIVGVSGSGKSTLMNILGLLDKSTEGQYFFAGKNVSNLLDNELAHIRNARIGFVFQSFFLLPRFTALQNVMLPLFYRDMPTALAKEKSLVMLEKMQVAHLAEHKPNQLSGGQQQRVAIARALVGEPDIILADEPTGALDSKTGDEVMNLLTNLNRHEGRTIVIITHDSAISRRCKRTVTIKDGQLFNE